MKNNYLVMLYAEGAGEAVSASLRLTSLEPLRVAHVYLYCSTKKVSQAMRIALIRKDWRAEFWFPGSHRTTENIEIPVEYRPLDAGDLFTRLMRKHLSFKLFL